MGHKNIFRKNVPLSEYALNQSREDQKECKNS